MCRRRAIGVGVGDGLHILEQSNNGRRRRIYSKPFQYVDTNRRPESPLGTSFFFRSEDISNPLVLYNPRAHPSRNLGHEGVRVSFLYITKSGTLSTQGSAAFLLLAQEKKEERKNPHRK